MHGKNEKNVVAACADAMFPPAGPIPVSGTEAGIVPYVRAYKAALPRLQRLLIALLFLFIQLSPWLVGPRRVRFTRLLPEERTVVLMRLSVSTVYFCRLALLSMRTIMTMAYFACPQVLAHIVRDQRRKELPCASSAP